MCSPVRYEPAFSFIEKNTPEELFFFSLLIAQAGRRNLYSKKKSVYSNLGIDKIMFGVGGTDAIKYTLIPINVYITKCSRIVLDMTINSIRQQGF